jgi:hypothetical protein
MRPTNIHTNTVSLLDSCTMHCMMYVGGPEYDVLPRGGANTHILDITNISPLNKILT